MSKRYSYYLPVFIFLCDLLALNIALYKSRFVVVDVVDEASLKLLFLSNLTWIFISLVTRNNHVRRPLVLGDNIQKLIRSLIYHLVIVFSVIYFLKITNISRQQVILSYAVFLLFAVIFRVVLFPALSYFRRKGFNHRQVMVIGDEVIARRLINSFAGNPGYGYDVVAFIPDNDAEEFQWSGLAAKILENAPDEVFLCYKHSVPELLDQLVRLGCQHQIKIKVLSDLSLQDSRANLINYGGLPVLQIVAGREISLRIRILKRSFDILFSSVVMLLGAPVFVFLYITTKITSRGPAFYFQERVGRNGRPFYIYKFRSMYVNAEEAGPQLSNPKDPRVTKWGLIMRNTKLDELPQFWNVLKGEMSVVGPRPERQHFIEKIVEKKPNYRKLQLLKPGITSIGQVRYGYAENIDQLCSRTRYDLLYLQNINLSHDLEIIWRTVKIMIVRKPKF